MATLSLNGTVPDLHDQNTFVNGNYSPEESTSNNMNNDEAGTPTYADAFPPLPAAPQGAATTNSAWGQNKQNKIKQPAVNKPILSSTSSQVFKIPYEERRYKNLSPIVGDAERQNELIRDVMHKTGTKIEVTVTKDQALNIMVSGKRDKAMEAKRKIIAGLQTQASIEMHIPSEHHKFILGKAGLKLRELEMLTQTRINIPRDSDVIRILGTKEGIDRARHEIQLISDEQAKLAFQRMNIPKIYHPFINGPEGEKCKEIASVTGARINIPPPSVMKDELTVAGEVASVQKAVDAISAIYKDRERKCKTVSIEVKKLQHRYVIGPRGAGIQDILRTTGVSVEMPSVNTESETIVLRGDQDKLGKALSLVYERANSIDSRELHAPKWLHRFIIGRKGENIKKITGDFDNKVHIEFLEDVDKILIEGPPAEVNRAESLLESSINDLKKTMSFADCKVDQKWHRHIIGKNGSNITRIKNETGTSINIPPDNEKSNIIRIEGSPEGVAAAKAEILQMAGKMENEKTRDIIIEHRFHKNIIGQKGEKVREIREKFTDVLISIPEPEKKSDIVTLRGPKDDVDKCYNYLKKLANDLVASNYRVEVPILKRFHGNIIGRNGANIKKINEETNTTIDIPAENSDSDIIVITGFKEQAHKAKKMILAIQSELANIVSKDIKIPQKLHTSMIGPKGKLIRSIMNECGDVNIRFPPEGEKSDVITLRGTKEDVEKAEDQLRKLAEDRQENSYTAEVTAKPEHHRFLIGRGGVNVRKVREKTGVHIIFPGRGDENRELITIIGKKDAVENAKTELMSKIKDLNNIIEGEINIDPKHHKYLAARRAQVLRDIGDENGGVVISLPKDASSSRVTLKGAKDCIESAKERLLEIVSDLESMVEIECVIEQKHHRSVLGNKGKNVQDLTSRLGVQIKFPDRRKSDSEEDEDPKNDVIVISGKNEKALEAKEALLALVPISKEIEIPFENHRFIIGQKGAGIRKLMDEYDVNILVPPADKQETLIKVTGPLANVEKALAALIKRNNEIEDENEERKLRNFEMIIDVPSKFHSKLIGRRGASIKKMRDDFGININVPPANIPADDERANQIKLIGYEDKCLKAKAYIDKIIKEAEDQVSVEVNIDNRIHSRIIGQRGKQVRKIMDKFKVDIQFPRGDNPDLVIIIGLEDDCDACKEHLLMLEEEYMDTIRERLEERQLMQEFTRPARNQQFEANEFIVRDAPWSQQPQQQQQQQGEYVPGADEATDFPSLGSKTSSGTKGRSWGPPGGR